MLEIFKIDIWSIISLVTTYIDWVAFFIVINLIGNIKIPNKKYALRVISIIVFVGIIDLASIVPNIKIILYIITGLLFYKKSYKDNIYKCIIVSLLFGLGIMVSEASSIGIVLMVKKTGSVQLLISSNLYKIEAIIISKILLTIELILFKYFRLSLEFKRKDMILISIPLLANIASLLLIFEYNLNLNIINRSNIIRLAITVLLIVLSSTTLLVVIGKIVQDDKLKLEYELINERIKINHKNHENINEIHNKLRYVYHDLKNHMTCMKSYDNKEEIISYINNLELQISDFENFKNTGNTTLDIILGEKIYICKKYNIEFEDYINISKLGFIQNSDICAIFSNALDNAIEACISIDQDIQKKIEVKVTYISGFAILKFINTKRNEIKFINERIQTSKGDNKIHGIGLASIKYIANKYSGEVIVNYSKEEFILKIMIPIENRRKLK